MSYLKSNWLSIIAMIIASMALLFCCKNCFVKNEEKIVGVWLIDAVGAPFQPHIATFHSDKTMEIHNPEAGDPHTSDSLGMGLWKSLRTEKNQIIEGKFIELNADRNTNKYVNKLVVSYKIIINGNTFRGPAQATYYNPDESIHSGPFSVTLNGKKLLLEQSNEQ